MATAQQINEAFGELRAILTEKPTSANWLRMVDIVDTLPEDFQRDIVAPYCKEHLQTNARWARFKRPIPEGWHTTLFTERRTTPAMTLVSHIDARCRNNEQADAFADLLTSSPDLSLMRTLSLRNFGFTDAHLGAFAASANFAHVRALHLTQQNSKALTAHGVRLLVTSPVMTHLELLDLSHNELGNDAAVAIAQHTTLPRLKWLKLDGNKITEAGGRAIEASDRLSGTIKANWKQYAGQFY